MAKDYQENGTETLISPQNTVPCVGIVDMAVVWLQQALNHSSCLSISGGGGDQKSLKHSFPKIRAQKRQDYTS